MPAASGTRIVRLDRVAPPSFEGVASDVAAGVDSVIVTLFRVFPPLPLRAQWIARITEFEWNHHFADVQDKGPFRSWHHRHEFAAETRAAIAGTLVRDIVEYEVGFGIFGQAANRLFVRGQMQQTFLARQRVLDSLLR